MGKHFFERMQEFTYDLINNFKGPFMLMWIKPLIIHRVSLRN